MADAPDREFAVFQRGEIRDIILAQWRNALRQKVNPTTGTTFAEDEIATATAFGSRYYNEADAIDIVELANQQRALWLADQVRIDRCGSSWLKEHHGRQWGEEPLPATGGTGAADATATVGTVFIGSTTIPDPAAMYATDPAGLRYQVLTNVTTPGSGTATLSLGAIDTGTQTNIASGVVLTWANGPVGADEQFESTAAFTGGTDKESDAEFASRLLARIRHKPASGNASHFRGWTRESTNSVEDAFVYCCALNSGNVIVVPMQKRASATGPDARIANATTLGTVRAYITPPGSAVVPGHVNVLVVPSVAQPSDVLLKLTMVKGRTSGWADPVPWPGYSSTVSDVTNYTSQSLFRVHSDTALPSGVTAPRLMVWNATTSLFERLYVTSVVAFGGGEYTVTLSQAATASLAVGSYISPDTERRDVIAEAVEEYFDNLGPGEVLDLTTSPLAERAYRFPEPTEEWSQRAGSGITTTLTDALGAALPNTEMISMSETVPDVPAYPSDGPSILTLGKLAIYSL